MWFCIPTLMRLINGKKKAIEFSGNGNFVVSDLLEINASEGEKREGLDFLNKVDIKIS